MGRVRLMAGEDVQSVAAGLLDLTGIDSVLLLPSSLSRRDALVASVRREMRSAGVESHLELPGNPLARLSRLARGGDRWRAVTISPPDRESRMVRLPSKLLDAGQVWVVTDIDVVSGRGPYALDLLSRYVDPLSRAKHLGSREREVLTVDVNLVRTPDRYVMLKDAGAFVLGAVTSDPIAAELLALSLADEDLTRDHRVTGPWEDPMVQRATELDLGARLPQDIRVAVSGQPTGMIEDTVARILARIGVSWP